MKIHTTVSYRNITCKSALHRVKGGFPYIWDLNLYRGCEHGCVYCYALYSHSFLDNNDGFYSVIYVKTNIVEHLERELSSSKWKREAVNLGSVCDSYQQAEEIYAYMPDILKIFIKYKTPVLISTKSSLILRDFDLLEELSRVAGVTVGCTITTSSPALQNLIEPGASSVEERFRVLSEFKNTNVRTGVHMIPIIPYITDKKDNLENIFSGWVECGAKYLLPGTLSLRSATRISFFNFIKLNFPKLYTPLDRLYKTPSLIKNYKNNLQASIKEMLKKYSTSGMDRDLFYEIYSS